MAQSSCAGCGASFTPYRPQHRYCLPGCRPSHGVDYARKTERTCENCGESFVGSRSKRFCSLPCFNVTQGSQWETKPCNRCGVDFTARKSNHTRFCSRACAAKARPRRIRARRIPFAECPWCAHWFVRKGPQKYCSAHCMRAGCPSTSTSAAISYGSCRQCGDLFVRHTGRLTEFCSSACSRRAAKNARKHLKRASGVGGRFTLREIAERDGWRCHICTKPVPDQPYAARDDDPTIDHLVPTSEGGTHTRDNVALAHNRCNWERGATGMAQLRLIA